MGRREQPLTATQQIAAVIEAAPDEELVATRARLAEAEARRDATVASLDSVDDLIESLRYERVENHWADRVRGLLVARSRAS